MAHATLPLPPAGGILDSKIRRDAKIASSKFDHGFAGEPTAAQLGHGASIQGQFLIYDTVAAAWKGWNGSAWEVLSITSFAGTFDAVAAAGKKVTSVAEVEIEKSDAAALFILDQNGAGGCLKLENASTGHTIEADDGGTSWFYVGKGGAKVVEVGASSQLNLLDGAVLGIGASQDITIQWDGTDLLIDGAAADTIIKIGATNNQDIIVYGDTVTDLITFDTSAELVTFNGFDLNFGDSDLCTFGDGQDITFTWNGSKFLIGEAGSNSAIDIGVDDAGIDVKFFGATSGSYLLWDQSADRAILEGADLYLGDSDNISFGDSQDVVVQWNGSVFLITAAADDTEIRVGANAGNAFDVRIYGNGSGDEIIFDASANLLALDGVDLRVEDSDLVKFGDADDITMTWNGTNFVVAQATANSAILLGADDAGIDLKLFGDTASLFVLWDQSADSLIFTDNAKIVLGTGSDVTIRWDGTDLDILAAADDSVINFGNGTNSFDVKVFGNTSSDYVLFDASANILSLAGAAYLQPFAITDPGNGGAIPVVKSGYCTLVSAGSETRTLADPAYDGEVIDLQMKTDGGNIVVTAASPLNQAGNNTITFQDVGDHIRLVGFTATTGDGAEWRVVCSDFTAGGLSTV